MLTLIEALGYRCLLDVQQPLRPFQVLVGPNASGKTTFLDVISLLGDVVARGPEAAVRRRTQNFEDLTWRREGTEVALAAEVALPEDRRPPDNPELDTARYEVHLGLVPATGEIGLLAERVLLRTRPVPTLTQVEAFPWSVPPRASLALEDRRELRKVVTKVPGGNDSFYPETSRKKWAPSFKLGPRKSALGNLPDDESNFPAATWLKRVLASGVQALALNSLHLRQASPPGQETGFKPDGANLPWVVHELEKEAPERLAEWMAHVRTALPDVQGVRTVERPDDRHRYLVVRYDGGLEIPSWMVSDGTLRLLALTLLAYLPTFAGTYLIEEPENGIHPRAAETVFQSLSSVHGAQVLMATHSPVILGVVEPQDVLCFARGANGATALVTGTDHPRLREWQGEADLSVLFAAGVLG